MSPKSTSTAAAIELAYQVKALVPELNAALTKAFHPLGLSCVQADALMALARIQPVRLKELAAVLVAESGHPSRLLARLEERGLVRRDPSPTDGRAVLLSLTADGERLAALAEDARRPLVAEVARVAGDEELRQAIELITRIRSLVD
ncbi:MarR family winged helix-turn-helix transcriptional regulator [Leifsonia sp. NPDC058248]|uniref:MarR family winged helix-turn-helix transcriptional regulator n=1 Tax=Leifsonia sp. NPDC058248 TaxID=3346402 RepID=UPI0036D79707